MLATLGAVTFPAKVEFPELFISKYVVQVPLFLDAKTNCPDVAYILYESSVDELPAPRYNWPPDKKTLSEKLAVTDAMLPTKVAFPALFITNLSPTPSFLMIKLLALSLCTL